VSVGWRAQIELDPIAVAARRIERRISIAVKRLEIVVHAIPAPGRIREGVPSIER